MTAVKKMREQKAKAKKAQLSKTSMDFEMPNLDRDSDIGGTVDLANALNLTRHASEDTVMVGDDEIIDQDSDEDPDIDTDTEEDVEDKVRRMRLRAQLSPRRGHSVDSDGEDEKEDWRKRSPADNDRDAFWTLSFTLQFPYASDAVCTRCVRLPSR